MIKDLHILVGILNKVEYKDWTFRSGTMDKGFFLQCLFDGRDIDTGKEEEQRGRKWYISQHMTEDEVVRTAFLAVMVATEHEVREAFLVNGLRVFGPHISVPALEGASHTVEMRASA